MTTDEKNYIASRYHEYANCLPEYRQPEKAEAIKQLMDFFGINELGQDYDSNITIQTEEGAVAATPFGSMLLEKAFFESMSLEELRQNRAWLEKWEESLRQFGQDGVADTVIELVEFIDFLEARIDE